METLLDDDALDRLLGDCLAQAAAFEAAATRLRAGELCDDMSRSFEQLCARFALLVEEAQRLGVEEARPTVADLRTALTRVRARDTQVSAIRSLCARARALAHRHQPHFAPLSELKRLAAALEDAFPVAPRPEPALLDERAEPLRALFAVLDADDPERRADLAIEAVGALGTMPLARDLVQAARRGELVAEHKVAQHGAESLVAVTAAVPTIIRQTDDHAAGGGGSGHPSVAQATGTSLPNGALRETTVVGGDSPADATLDASAPAPSVVEPAFDEMEAAAGAEPSQTVAENEHAAAAQPLAPAAEAVPTTPATRERRPAPLAAGHRTFEEYKARWWVRGDRVEDAPWTSPRFTDQLRDAFIAAFRAPHFGRLAVLAAAGEQLGVVGLPTRADIDDIVPLWSLAPAQRSETRAERLRAELAESRWDQSLSCRVALTLEALSPSSGVPLRPEEVEVLIDGCGLRGDLALAVRDLLRIAVFGDPVTYVRSHLKVTASMDRAAERQELVQQRRALHERFQRMMQRKMFNFRTGFCMELWLTFLRGISAQVQPLFPDAKGDVTWDPRAMARALESAERSYVSQMDRGGARHVDRDAMDRCAGEFFLRARDVNALAAKTSADASARPSMPPIKLELEPFRRIVGHAGADDDEDATLRRLIGRVVRNEPADQAGRESLMAFGIPDVLASPALVALLGPASSDPRGLMSLDDSASKLEAAAHLISGGVPTSAAGSSNDLLETLRDPRWRLSIGKLAHMLPESERVVVHEHALAIRQKAREIHASLRAKHALLREVSAPEATSLYHALVDVERRVEAVRSDEIPLLVSWLEALLTYADAAVAQQRRAVSREAQLKGPEVREAVETLLASDRLGDAFAIMRGGAPGAAPPHRSTLFRFEAAVVYADPRKRLQKLEGEKVVERWLNAAATVNEDRARRADFCRTAFGDRIYDRSEKTAEYVAVPTEEVRRYLVSAHLNPSYVPQLANFHSLVFARVDSPTSSPQFAERAADVAARQGTSERVALVVVLAPRLTLERRQEVLSAFRRRKGLRAAVLDDVDMCRLINPGGERPNQILGLMEIVLEQQSWAAVSPFQLVDGQHVQIEMYVGREQEARELAQTAKYSRLFSGRKLGKSALLRYVERHFDKTRLASGVTLRVVYVSAVGRETGLALVEAIVEKLTDRFEVTTAVSSADPLERLERALAAIASAHPDLSLLIVLDEADVFVERELDEYQQHFEKCLSFQMRSRLEERRDSQGLPRVRFVFTGYRVTNTREGAWANWGDVLRLVPLPASDAASLVAGPLAVLGIDAREQASAIAHRCGFQPAVILRFGDRLLTRLDQRFTPDARARAPVVVTREDVAHTFEDEAVQQEIRTVAKNNFQGNDVARIVFGAMIAELLEVGPAYGLEHLDEVLESRLRALGGDSLDWLRRDGGAVRDELRRHIDDLVARQLVEEHRTPGSPTQYYLKFPHHLPVLAQLGREEHLRAEIERVRQQTVGTVRASRGLLPRGRVSTIHSLAAEVQAELPIVPVFARVWGSAEGARSGVLHRGLLDHLGFDHTHVDDADKVLGAASSLLETADRVALLDVRPDHIDRLLSRRPRGLPVPLLIGGMDLIRDAFRSGDRFRGHEQAGLQVFGPRRVTRSVLGWWLERARGLNFTEADSIDVLFGATGGVPLLVGAADAALTRMDPDGSGLEVTRALLDEALAKLAADHARFATDLRSGPDWIKLSAREMEILAMVKHVVSAEARGQATVCARDITVGLSEGWSLYSEGLPPGHALASVAPIASDAREDEVAMLVLIEAGLLPCGDDEDRRPAWERLGDIRSDDPVLRLL
jgi:hypothetical protein